MYTFFVNSIVVLEIKCDSRTQLGGCVWQPLCFGSGYSSSSPPPSVGPVVSATDVLQPKRLIVLTLFPRVFRRSHVRRQMPSRPSPMTREILVVKGGTMWARINRKFCLRLRLPRQFRDLLHAANLRHGTHGFTSLPKEGVLRIFSPWKILTASAGFEPANLGT